MRAHHPCLVCRQGQAFTLTHARPATYVDDNVDTASRNGCGPSEHDGGQWVCGALDWGLGTGGVGGGERNRAWIDMGGVDVEPPGGGWGKKKAWPALGVDIYIFIYMQRLLTSFFFLCACVRVCVCVCGPTATTTIKRSSATLLLLYTD